MSASNSPCSVCKRPVGGQHRDPQCPRSPGGRLYLENSLRKVPKAVWLIGDNVFRRPKADGTPGRSIVRAWNPGVPYVRRPYVRTYNRGRTKRRGGNRNWRTGGIPKGMEIEAKLFAKALGLSA